MDPDQDLNLKAAFAELHRRQREQAPPFEAMYERAVRQARHRQHSGQPLTAVRRLAWTAVAACVAAVGMWGIGQLTRPPLPKLPQVDSTARVDELITAIEEQLQRKDTNSFVEYPTDMLLAENQTDFAE